MTYDELVSDLGTVTKISFNSPIFSNRKGRSSNNYYDNKFLGSNDFLKNSAAICSSDRKTDKMHQNEKVITQLLRSEVRFPHNKA